MTAFKINLIFWIVWCLIALLAYLLARAAFRRFGHWGKTDRNLAIVISCLVAPLALLTFLIVYIVSGDNDSVEW